MLMIRDLVLLALRLAWAAVLFIVGGRFVILLFNLDKTNQIVDWIMRKSDFWVKPFFNLFHLANKAVDRTGGVFEPASLIAFVVYFVVGAIILSFIASALSFGGYGGSPRRRPWLWG